MRKLAIGILTTAMVIGAGTATFASGDGEGVFNLEKMKPYMQKMHHDFSETQLKDMFESCHGENGSMKNTNFKIMNEEGMNESL
ncbi:hypothetical protein [Bacillus sp. PS06]|uniref:hypothetical protein n=1 Tax=Bacillus sp. PS06 TaxID=2764176 RepID=UPI0017858648|nr:hypothetical protein [Bacillus sp. PS06]MBD8069270.1 hypothetical protein [Bacillus sp. PS06]